MYKSIEMFTLICDNCGADSNADSEFRAWSDKSSARDMAMDSDWIEDEGKHYCPACYSIDDEDNYIFNVSKKVTNG